MPTEAATLPLIRTKLYRPRNTVDLVPRPRLLKRLEERRGRLLTLISTPIRQRQDHPGEQLARSV